MTTNGDNTSTPLPTVVAYHPTLRENNITATFLSLDSSVNPDAVEDYYDAVKQLGIMDEFCHLCHKKKPGNTRCPLELVNRLHDGRVFQGNSIVNSRIWRFMKQSCSIVASYNVDVYLHPKYWSLPPIVEEYWSHFEFHEIEPLRDGSVIMHDLLREVRWCCAMDRYVPSQEGMWTSGQTVPKHVHDRAIRLEADAVKRPVDISRGFGTRTLSSVF